jgi:hypothetical protein
MEGFLLPEIVVLNVILDIEHFADQRNGVPKRPKFPRSMFFFFYRAWGSCFRLLLWMDRGVSSPINKRQLSSLSRELTIV